MFKKLDFKNLLLRCKNTKVITGITSGILLILVNLNVISDQMSHNILTALNTILSIGVGVGIFGNPETPFIKK